MNKINLPPLPPIPWNALGGIANDCISAEAIRDYATAYAEQAVREALEVAAQALGDMSQKEFERPGFSWPTHMAYHQAMQTIRALTPSGGSGHKPATVDTSSGHSAGNGDEIDTSTPHVEQIADHRHDAAPQAKEP